MSTSVFSTPLGSPLLKRQASCRQQGHPSPRPGTVCSPSQQCWTSLAQWDTAFRCTLSVKSSVQCITCEAALVHWVVVRTAITQYRRRGTAPDCIDAGRSTIDVNCLPPVIWRPHPTLPSICLQTQVGALPCFARRKVVSYIYLRKAPLCMNPSWYRWLAHLTLTQETGVRVPVTELLHLFGRPLPGWQYLHLVEQRVWSRLIAEINAFKQ